MPATALSPVPDLPTEAQPRAFSAGAEVLCDAALDEAARLIATARTPLILLSCDSAATLAALRLAEACRAIVDVMQSEALAREVQAMQGRGGYWTTQREAFARADVVLIAGGRAAEHTFTRTLQDTEAALTGARRDILNLAEMPGPCGGKSIKPRIALLGALVKPNRAPPFEAPGYAEARAFAGRLAAAKFGVALWSPEDLDSLDIAGLMALVDTLNAATRFTSLSLRPAGNGWGITQIMLAQWGVPPRSRWLGHAAGHDPWRYGAPRLTRAGEADAIVAVSSFGAAFHGLVPERTIAFAPDAGPGTARIAIPVGRPGVDHAATWYDEGRDAVVDQGPAGPAGQPSAADLLASLARRLGARAL